MALCIVDVSDVTVPYGQKCLEPVGKHRFVLVLFCRYRDFFFALVHLRLSCLSETDGYILRYL